MVLYSRCLDDRSLIALVTDNAGHAHLLRDTSRYWSEEEDQDVVDSRVVEMVQEWASAAA